MRAAVAAASGDSRGGRWALVSTARLASTALLNDEFGARSWQLADACVGPIWSRLAGA